MFLCSIWFASPLIDHSLHITQFGRSEPSRTGYCIECWPLLYFFHGFLSAGRRLLMACCKTTLDFPLPRHCLISNLTIVYIYNLHEQVSNWIVRIILCRFLGKTLPVSYLAYKYFGLMNVEPSIRCKCTLDHQHQHLSFTMSNALLIIFLIIIFFLFLLQTYRKYVFHVPISTTFDRCWRDTWFAWFTLLQRITTNTD